MNSATAPITRDPVVHAADGGQRLWFSGGTATVLAAGEDTGEAYGVVVMQLPEGVATPWHRHPEGEESFLVLEGELVARLGDEPPVRLGPGGFLHVPAGLPHAFAVRREARLVNVTTPDHVRFVRAAGDPAGGAGFPPPGPPDLARLGAAAAAHGTELLGPPPSFD